MQKEFIIAGDKIGLRKLLYNNTLSQKMMIMKKQLIFIVLFVFVFQNCKNKEDVIKETEVFANLELLAANRKNLRPYKDLDIKDLYGDWCFTQIRTALDSIGRPVDEKSVFMEITITKKGEFVSYTPIFDSEQTDKNMDFLLTIRNGRIIPQQHESGFDKYFGGYIEVLKVTKNELMIRCGNKGELTKIIKPNEFWYLTKCY